MGLSFGLIEVVIMAAVVGGIIFFIAKSMGGNEKND